MKLIKYGEKIVKSKSGIISQPSPPPIYKVVNLKYSILNCGAACSLETYLKYFIKYEDQLQEGTIIYLDSILSKTVLSGYYASVIGGVCYWVDGDGIIVQISECGDIG